MGLHSWLLEVARHAALANVEHLPKDLKGSTEDAWTTVAMVCDLQPSALAELVARHYGLQTSELVPTAAALQLLPESFARLSGVLPLRTEGSDLVVAIDRPPDRPLSERIEFATELTPRYVIAPPAQLALTTAAAYEALAQRSRTLNVDGFGGGLGVGVLAAQSAAVAGDDTEAMPVVKLTNMILAEAVRVGASDIHLQPILGLGNLRFRIDGRLQRKALLPAKVMRRIIGRVKALSGMNPTDNLHAQDGSASISSLGVTYDLRASTLPVHDGEKLVVRFLPNSGIKGLAQIGLGEPEIGQLESLLARGTGLLLVTGPTGCGKTTTLHSALSERNRTEVNIVTIEDPVEYRVARLAQVQVNTKSGLTFANALRSVLRQDPDIILVGEVRDAETAGLVAQAALTGHLVLSTLHTIDAVNVVPRLLDLGVLPSVLSECLSGVVTQRLVRRLCSDCRRPATEPLHAAETWLRDHAGVAEPMRELGCAACNFTGYRGRLVIAQVLQVNPGFRQLVAEGARVDALRAAAREGGMRTLAESALDRLRAGETTYQEVVDELGNEFWAELGADQLAFATVTEAFDESHRLLLVQRDPRERAGLRAALEDAGFRVAEAVDAVDARIEVQREGDYAAMVIDLDGLMEPPLQPLLDLRATLTGAAMPVVVLTSGRSEAIATAAAAHECTTLLQKPAGADAIVNALEQWLEEG